MNSEIIQLAILSITKIAVLLIVAKYLLAAWNTFWITKRK
ncbi:hypothetical protein LCGC14_1351130 [marine sediment metagenome]|uniref:Uncharacterized protein n=1 Tax=marine sediment metagenome TaxID=412755 RepID=A0A0F9MRP7_9ZZZZ